MNRTENKKDTCGKINDFMIVTLPFNDKFLEDHILVSTFILLSLSSFIIREPNTQGFKLAFVIFKYIKFPIRISC